MLGLTYMRLYPEGIRSAILDSGMPAQVQDGLDFWRGGAEMLEKIFAGCAANAACNAAYPGLRASFYELVKRLEAHPARITIPDVGGKPLSMSISGAFFYEDAVYGIFPGNRFEPEHIHDLLSELWRASHGELTEVYVERVSARTRRCSTPTAASRGGRPSRTAVATRSGSSRRTTSGRAAADVPPLAPYFLDRGLRPLRGRARLSGRLQDLGRRPCRPGPAPARLEHDPDARARR